MSKRYYGTMKEDGETMIAAIESYTWQMYAVVTGDAFDGGLSVFGPFVDFEEAKEALEASGKTGSVTAFCGRDLDYEFES